MHGYPDVVTSIEEFGHVGHGAVLHGCIVGKDALIGMNTVVMDESVIGEGSIVGAMSFVKAGVVFPEQSLIVGSPAKVIRKVSAEELKWKKQGTKEYIELAKRSQETMIETSPLSEPEPNRKAFAIDHITLAQTKKK
jgi:phenylacetic acid degradation protein